MSKSDNEIVRTDAIAKDYGLKEPLAREIVTEETHRALRKSKLCWLIVPAGVGLAGWLYVEWTAHPSIAFWVILGTVLLWLTVGRYLAGPAIRKAAAEKAARLKGLGG